MKTLRRVKIIKGTEKQVEKKFADWSDVHEHVTIEDIKTKIKTKQEKVTIGSNSTTINGLTTIYLIISYTIIVEDKKPNCQEPRGPINTNVTDYNVACRPTVRVP